MKTSARFTLLFLAFVFQVGTGIAQPTRLWAYARYEQLSPTANRLVDLGRFTYSGTRGLAVDSTPDFLPFYYLFLNLPSDFSQLNAWFVHRHQSLPARVVTQFDTFRSWQWDASSASLQPRFSAVKTHTGGRLDSLTVVHNVHFTQSFRYEYDALGKPISCRVWRFSAAANAWQRMDGMRLVRNAASQPLERRRDYFNFNGAYSESLVSTYYYNAQGSLDSLNTLDSVSTGVYPVEREHYRHDGLGRLDTWGQYSYNSSGGYWMYHGRDSFNYDGTSNRPATNYRVTSGFLAPYLQHAHTYDANGRLASYADGYPNYKTFVRAADGRVTQINETGPAGDFKTYFYYDSVAAAGVIAAGVADAARSSSTAIEIYPNPATSKVFLKSVKTLSAYRLYSMTGQEVLSGAMVGTEASLSVTSLPPGAYLLYVEHHDGSRSAARVMKY